MENSRIILNLVGERGVAICDHEELPEFPELPDPDEECPLDTDDIIYIPGDYCGKFH